MKYPTISYLEARNPTTGELLDTLYIGKCDYNIKQFNIRRFTDPQYMYPAISVDGCDYGVAYKTMVSCAEMDAPYHITKLKNTIRDFEPTTMDDDSALYDMKMVVHWVESQPVEAQQFVFVTYQAVGI